MARSNRYLRKIVSSGAATDLDITGDVEIDGVAQINNTLTVGVDDTGHDVKFFGATSGRYMQWNESDDKLKISDGAEIGFGNADDLKIYHDGSNSYIKQQNARTGSLYIDQDTNDADIVFRNDDGSGGRTAYITLDGSETRTVIAKAMRFNDSTSLQLGGDADISMHHDGSNGFFSNTTGNLTFTQNTDDGDIIFKCDNGSGGTTAYITLDGGLGYSRVHKNLRFDDSTLLALGVNNDFIAQHDGTDTLLYNDTGDLYITNRADDKDIIFQCDDGSGGLTTYLHVDGNSTLSKFLKPVNFGVDGSSVDVTFYGDTSGRNMFWDASQDKLRASDNVQLTVGSSVDFQISHDGTNTLLQNNTGNLDIKNNQNDGDITLSSDDGSGGMTPYLTLDGSSAKTKFSKFTLHEDNVKAEFGDGADLQIYHDGTHGQIVNNSSNLYIKNNANDSDIVFQSDDGSGGSTTYFYLDGSATQTRFDQPTRHSDNIKVLVGSSGDAAWWHDGTKSRLDNYTGNLEITNYVDDSDILFKSDDGSGGTETYFFLDGSRASASALFTVFPDNSYIALGNAVDFKLHHNGNSSTIENEVGNLNIINDANDKDITFFCDDGSGGVTSYITLDGSQTTINLEKTVLIGTTTNTGAYKIDVAGKQRVQDTLELDDVLMLNAISTPSDPAAGKSVIYMDSSDGGIKCKINVGGTVVTRTLASFE